MEYFRVKNWERFQHYKRRNPPWIKLYTHLLDDYEFSSLGDASKLLALFILMLAAKANNKLPLDPAWIQRRTGLQEKPDLEPLFGISFILRIDAGELLAQRKQSSMPEERRGEETEADIQRGKKNGPSPLIAASERISERFKRG